MPVNYSKNKVTLATVLLLVLCLIVLPLISLSSPVQAAPWTKYTGEVTLDGELFVVDGWVIKEGATYKMWYTHGRTDMDIGTMVGNLTTIISSDLLSDFVNLDLTGLLDEMANIAVTPAKMDALWTFMTDTTNVIGYAESSDGIDWDVVNDEVLAGTSGTLESVGMPCVINDSGTYKMWFTHSVTSLDKTGLQTILGDLDNPTQSEVRDALIALADSTTSAIGYTSSVDETSWDAPTMNVFSGAGGGLWESVSSPCIINEGGTYKMWYTYAETDITTTDIENILSDIGNFGVTDIMNILDNTNTVIGYTTSADGTTWTAGHAEVLAGSGGGVWDSVSTPCVINNGSNYEMWSTYTETDLTSTEIQDIFDELQAMETDITDMWESYNAGDLNPFLTNFTDLIDTNTNMQNIKALMANTGNKIGYSTSADGTTWNTATEALAGNGGPWDSVSAPCVILDSGTYEMWFAQGMDNLTAQNIIELMDGSNLPIGYATFGVDIDLVTDWNFIGMPLNPVPADTADVIGDIIADVQTIWAYDAATATWHYYTTLVGPPQGDLLLMNVGVGYWVECTNPATLTVSGAEPAYPYNINLVIGWNLISIPKTPSPSTTADVLSGIITNVQTVWSYDAATATWDYYTTIVGPPQGNLTNITEGEAYWIEMTAADTLTIN